MAIKVQLVLPDNLRSTFLRGDFVNQGETYTTLIQSNNKERDKNRHTLSFGFKLVEDATREPVTITRIKSLKISNDPNFDAPSTIEITDWPAGTFNAGNKYVLTLNPDYFFNPALALETSRSEIVDGDEGGFFYVENWPLSANGGLSTVYFEVVILSGTEEVTYPGSYGIFDQIHWQTERPSTPGKPNPECISSGWTNRRSLWRFRASEEPSTGLYSNGIARYLGDIIEVRQGSDLQVGSVGTYNLISTLSPTGPSTLRTIIPSLTGTTTTATDYLVTMFGTFSNSSYDPGTGATIGTPIATATGALGGRAWYTNDKIQMTSDSPDICVQAHVSMVPADIKTATRYVIKAVKTTDPETNSNDEIALWVTVPSYTSVQDTYEVPKARIYHENSDSSYEEFELPMHLVPKLLNGGVLELYVSRRTDAVYAAGYFTPDSDPHESVFLASAVLKPLYSLNDYVGGAIMGGTDGGSGTFDVNELAVATGKFLLNVDLGDCFTDDVSPFRELTGSVAWSSALTNGTWNFYSEFKSDLLDTGESSTNSTTQTATSTQITLTAKNYAKQFTTAEVQRSVPSFSERTEVRFEVDHTAGEFYVAFSPNPVDDQPHILRPMGTRCNPYSVEMDEPMFKPTILVGFTQNHVYVSQRNIDNTLTTKHIVTYEPDVSASFETWTVRVSSLPPYDNADGTYVVLYRGEQVVGDVRLERRLPAASGGLGHYVALGVRGQRLTDALSSSAIFKSVAVRGLPETISQHEKDGLSMRHFVKAKTGAANAKAFLGQKFLAGQTDSFDFPYTAPAGSEYTTCHATTCGANIDKTEDAASNILDIVPSKIDYVPLYLGWRVLVKDQTDPTENGIYEVKYDSVNSAYYWERATDFNQDQDITPGKYVTVHETWMWYSKYIHLAQTSNVADFTAAPTTVDSVAIQVGYRILVKGQTDKTQNGIYKVTAINTTANTATWVRDDGMDVNSDLDRRWRFFVKLGTTNAGTYWGIHLLTTQNPPDPPYELGVTEIYFVKQRETIMLHPCRVATTTALPNSPTYSNGTLGVGATLTSTVNGALALDGVALSVGDRVLVKDQGPTQEFEHGVYVVTNSGSVGSTWTLTRATEFDEVAEIVPQTRVSILEGTVNAQSNWIIRLPIPEQPIGTMDIEWNQGPTQDGSLWRLDDIPGIVTVNVSEIHWKSHMYAQQFSLGTLSPHTDFDKFNPELLEINIRVDDDGVDNFEKPAIKFYEVKINPDEDGHPVPTPGAPVSDWVKAYCHSPMDQRILSMPTEGNSLVQFDLTPFPPYLSKEKDYYIVVRLPAGCSLGAANAESEGQARTQDTEPHIGWQIIESMFFKLYAYRQLRSDNSTHLAALQTRVCPVSHANKTGFASPLADELRVDLNAPTSASVSGRPFVHTALNPAVRSIMLNIESTDADSGMLAFRIGKETDHGLVRFTPWQPWSQYLEDAEVIYTVYLYGTYDKNPLGDPESDLILSQNLGFDGGRRVWAQVMDGAGNISESFPLNVLAQSMALIDTTPPSGTLEFISGVDASTKEILNSFNTWLELTGQDRVSAVKDIRFRALKAGTARDWSHWRPISTYQKWSIDDDISSELRKDGLKRLEAQFRDYGNNIETEAPLWDAIYEAADKDVLFIAMEKWTAPDAEETLYLSGIKSEDYTGLTLVDSEAEGYDAGTAFYAKITSGGSIGRRVYVRTTDNLIVYDNGVPTTSYTVEDGLVVFSTAPVGPMTIDIHRDSAQLFKWDGEAVVKVADLGYLEERAILSMCATDDVVDVDEDNVLYLGSASGRIWKYDGHVITGPVYTALESAEELPITSLRAHQFDHEDAPYLYATTAKYPRLFRAPVANADGNAWEAISPTGTYLESMTGDILCSESYYGALFLGTAQGKVLRYSRALVETEDTDEVETVSESNLLNPNIGQYDGTVLPIQTLLASGGNLFAGIGDRPEIWNYVEVYEEQPYTLGNTAVDPGQVSSNQLHASISSRRAAETWSLQPFDKWFMLDPTPWQYYSNFDLLGSDPNFETPLNDSGRTLSRSDRNLEGQSITSPFTENGYRDLLVVNGGPEATVSQFSTDTGSDWEQVMSLNASANTLADVKVATTTTLPFSPVYNNGSGTLTAASNGILTVDGVNLVLNDRILVKDQATKTQNGVYTVTTAGTVSVPYVLTRATELNQNSEFVANTMVKASSGDVNKGNHFLLQYSASYVLGTTELIWLRPTYAAEFELMSLEGTGKQGFELHDGYYALDVQVNTNELTINSGDNTATKTLNSDVFVSLSHGGLFYPESGVRYAWNFFDSTQEDRGPYWTGRDGGDDDALGWKAGRYVVPQTDNAAGTIEDEEETSATFTNTTHYLKIEPGENGDPRIINTSMGQIRVDMSTKLYIRVRVNTSSSDLLKNAKIRFTWSEGNQISDSATWMEQPLEGTDQFVTYTFAPAWNGFVRAIAFEFQGIPDGEVSLLSNHTRGSIDVDHIVLAAEVGNTSIRDNFVPIRVMVEGRDVKVWYGKSVEPIFYKKNFLTLPTTESSVRFGKINPDEVNSAFAYSKFRFIVGGSESERLMRAPVRRTVRDFALQQRLPSTGGVRCLVNHLSTAYALTDGITEMRKADNPDDRASKVFAYIPELESWKHEDPPYPRENDTGQGVVRPLSAKSFYGTLVVAGQRGPIRYA